MRAVGAAGSSATRLCFPADGPRPRSRVESRPSTSVLSPPRGPTFRPKIGAAPGCDGYGTAGEGPGQVTVASPAGRRASACPKRAAEIGRPLRSGDVGPFFSSFTHVPPVGRSRGAGRDVAATFADPRADSEAVAAGGSRSNAVHRRGCIKQRVGRLAGRRPGPSRRGAPEPVANPRPAWGDDRRRRRSRRRRTAGLFLRWLCRRAADAPRAWQGLVRDVCAAGLSGVIFFFLFVLRHRWMVDRRKVGDDHAANGGIPAGMSEAVSGGRCGTGRAGRAPWLGRASGREKCQPELA